MRIISGKHKSKRLIAPKNLPVRPTTDMAKEALFNILNNNYYFDNLNVLDLFAGTGNISLEFGSRGTENITAVDMHYGCIKYINTISKSLNMSIQTVKSDVFKYLEKTTMTHDVIFADPPYEFEQRLFEKIATLVFEKKLLNDNGILIVEHSKHTDLSNHPFFNYSKKYGGNMFSFFEKKEVS
jgi:16S rRNA (guanine(966)-N(2))-methyltransferase RsmD